MFKKISKKIDSLPVNAKKEDVFSFDSEGKEVTYQELQKNRNISLKPVSQFTDKEIDSIVLKQIEKIPDGEAIVLLGHDKSYDKKSLKDEVQKKSSVGRNFIEQTLNYHRFLRDVFDSIEFVSSEEETGKKEINFPEFRF